MDLDKAKELGVCRVCEIPFKGIDVQPAGWQDRFGSLVYPQSIVLDFGKEFAHEACLPHRIKIGEPPEPNEPSLSHWGSKGSYTHHADCYFWSYKFCDCGLLNHIRYTGLRDDYPNYDSERFSHTNRVDLIKDLIANPKESTILKEWEAKIKKMAVNYTEVECSGCGEPMLEYVMIDKDGKPKRMSEFFGDTFGPYVTICKKCDALGVDC
jgi:hypothetical protein